MSRMTALISALLLALSCAVTVVPPCVSVWTADRPHPDEVRLRDAMRRLELAIRDEPDGARREWLRERFREVYDRLEEIGREQRRRAERQDER
jgi:hypothetical protein